MLSKIFKLNFKINLTKFKLAQKINLKNLNICWHILVIILSFKI